MLKNSELNNYQRKLEKKLMSLNIHSLRLNLEKTQNHPKAFTNYLQQIDIACDQIS